MVYRRTDSIGEHKESGKRLTAGIESTWYHNVSHYVTVTHLEYGAARKPTMDAQVPEPVWAFVFDPKDLLQLIPIRAGDQGVKERAQGLTNASPCKAVPRKLRGLAGKKTRASPRTNACTFMTFNML